MQPGAVAATLDFNLRNIGDVGETICLEQATKLGLGW
jgi:hypothetical protein